MEVAAPIALGVMLVVSLLILGHNARRGVIRRRWLIPLLAFGPVGIPLLAFVAMELPFLSPAGGGMLLLAGSGFCFAVWTAAVLGYWVFSATKNQKSPD